MKRWLTNLILCFLAVLFSWPVDAQPVLPPDGAPHGVACAYNTSPPTASATGEIIWAQCDSTGHLLTVGSGGGGGGAITGPLGPSTLPAAAVAVVAPDDLNVCTGSNLCTVTGIGALFTQDTIGYESISVQITANAGGGTIAFESSDDNTNWIGMSGLSAGTTGTSVPVSTSAAPAAIFNFQKRARYFRARTSSGAGVVTVVGTLHKAASLNILAAPSLQAGIAAIGKVGPGFTSAQTPIQGNGTGSTGAVVGTLAAAASKTTYLCDFDISATGGVATLGPIVVAGLLGGSKTYQLFSTATGANLSKTFTPCLPSSAVNTAITITTTADGTASAVDVNSSGYQE